MLRLKHDEMQSQDSQRRDAGLSRLLLFLCRASSAITRRASSSSWSKQARTARQAATMALWRAAYSAAFRQGGARRQSRSAKRHSRCKIERITSSKLSTASANADAPRFLAAPKRNSCREIEVSSQKNALLDLADVSNGYGIRYRQAAKLSSHRFEYDISQNIMLHHSLHCL